MSPTNTSPDITDPQSLNQYSYADNDPTSPGQVGPPGDLDNIFQGDISSILARLHGNQHCLSFLKDLLNKLWKLYGSSHGADPRWLAEQIAGVDSTQKTEAFVRNMIQHLGYDTNVPPGCTDEIACTYLGGTTVHVNIGPYLNPVTDPDRAEAWLHEAFHSGYGPGGNGFSEVDLANQLGGHFPNPPPSDTRAYKQAQYKASKYWDRQLEKNCGPRKKKCGKN